MKRPIKELLFKFGAALAVPAAALAAVECLNIYPNTSDIFVSCMDGGCAGKPKANGTECTYNTYGVACVCDCERDKNCGHLPYVLVPTTKQTKHGHCVSTSAYPICMSDWWGPPESALVKLAIGWDCK